MDLRILSPLMGRKKKLEVRGAVSIRMLPEIERRLTALVESRNAKSKSSLAESLLATAIEIATFDQSFTELVETWKKLSARDRGVLLRMAHSLEPIDVPIEPDWLSDLESAPNSIRMSDPEPDGDVQEIQEDVKQALKKKPRRQRPK